MAACVYACLCLLSVRVCVRVCVLSVFMLVRRVAQLAEASTTTTTTTKRRANAASSPIRSLQSESCAERARKLIESIKRQTHKHTRTHAHTHARAHALFNCGPTRKCDSSETSEINPKKQFSLTCKVSSSVGNETQTKLVNTCLPACFALLHPLPNTDS